MNSAQTSGTFSVAEWGAVSVGGTNKNRRWAFMLSNANFLL